MDDNYNRVGGPGLVEAEGAKKFARTETILDKITAFANSWTGWGIAVLVSLGPTLFGWWAQNLEETCLVNSESTVEDFTACSNAGKFDAKAAECAKVFTDDIDVAFQFNMALSIYMAGFIGFTTTIVAAKLEKVNLPIVGNMIAISGIISIISVYQMHKYRVINEEGIFCSGGYSDENSGLAPLYYKGLFIKSYLICFWIGVGTLTIGSIALCAFVYKSLRNRPGAALI